MRIRDIGGSVGKAVTHLETRNVPTDPGYMWAGIAIPFHEACKHFVVVGATGSGKSVTLNLLMQSVLCKMRSDGIKRRLLVYDSKADLVNFVANHLPAGVPMRLLNPLDSRFAPWDISADVMTETDALEFASILIPKNEKESSPYFSDTARALLAGVVQRLILTGAWTLRDVLLAFHDLKTLRAVLNHPETDYLIDHFEKANEKNLAGVKSSIDTALAIYRPIAALYNAAQSTKRTFSPTALGPIDPNKFSLRDWINGDGVMVLGTHENARAATDTLNRLLFRQLSKLLIAREAPEADETWIFLDETREAGALDGLRQLLLRGRSKRVAVVMGFQDVEGMYAAYGDHEGAEIIGAAHNVALLHINPTAPKTAEWASNVFGSRRKPVQSINEQYKDGGIGTTTTLAVEPNVLPLEFTQHPTPTPDDGLEYYAYTADKLHGKGHYKAEYLKTYGPWKPGNTKLANFVDWDAKDAWRFRLNATAPAEGDTTVAKAEPLQVPRKLQASLDAVNRGRAVHPLSGG